MHWKSNKTTTVINLEVGNSLESLKHKYVIEKKKKNQSISMVK